VDFQGEIYFLVGVAFSKHNHFSARVLVKELNTWIHYDSMSVPTPVATPLQRVALGDGEEHPSMFAFVKSPP